jgi:hypothetical protein
VACNAEIDRAFPAIDAACHVANARNTYPLCDGSRPGAAVRLLMGDRQVCSRAHLRVVSQSKRPLRRANTHFDIGSSAEPLPSGSTAKLGFCYQLNPVATLAQLVHSLPGGACLSSRRYVWYLIDDFSM